MVKGALRFQYSVAPTPIAGEWKLLLIKEAICGSRRNHCPGEIGCRYGGHSLGHNRLKFRRAANRDPELAQGRYL
jgi:hypothetical protein